MKKYKNLFLFALLLFFVDSALAQKANTTNIFGYYTIEKSPKDFADISEIHLSGDYGAQLKPPVYGLIRLKKKGAKDFLLLKPKLNGKNLTFTTKAVGGISYQFDGIFTKLGNFPETRPEGEILLKGELTKYKGKTKIAGANVGFSYSAGD
jgi:hypothetical protein